MTDEMSEVIIEDSFEHEVIIEDSFEHEVIIEDSFEHELFQHTMEKKWKDVVKIYKDHPSARKTQLNTSEETALHIAISSYHSKSPQHATYIKKMIDPIDKDTDVLSMQNVRRETPLHLAAAVGCEDICKWIASKRQDPDLFHIRNEKGETPLFIAAHHGNLKAFLCLHGLQPDESLCRRKDGNTVLHSAISGEYFGLAYQIIRFYPNLVNSVNVEGESPLHVLAKKPNVFKSSSHLRLYDSIIYHCTFVEELKMRTDDPTARQNLFSLDTDKLPGPKNYRTCIGTIILLWRLTDIIAGGVSWYKKKTDSRTDEENQQTPQSETSPSQEQSAKAYQTGGRADEKSNAAGASLFCWPRAPKKSEMGSVNEGKGNSNHGGFYPPNYFTCIQLFKFAMKVILTILGVGFGRIKKIQMKKERYTHALEIMNELINKDSTYKKAGNGQRPDKNLKLERSEETDIPNEPPKVDEDETSSTNPQCKNVKEKDSKSEEKSTPKGLVTKKDTPILVAAKMGILEMVKKIYEKYPVAIQDEDSKGKNVLMLAAEYRQTTVFDYLMGENLPEYMIHQLDNEENSILHLAAKLGKLQPWRIPGAALQMQWEIKWYKHVKRSLSQSSLNQPNSNGEIPRTVLTKTHVDLMKAGNDWLIKTSESCSVVAALIAAVAFATSATVPGGLDEERGYPILKDHKAFDVFSITSLVALCLSITALVFFLAIITSRCEERDFKSNLPKKLLMGLSSLFASIAAMLLSFCAGHTFILREELNVAALPIYTIATIPVTFFALAQLPLYFDLLWAACRRVPLRSHKVFYQ